jgi:hypothetical protein
LYARVCRDLDAPATHNVEHAEEPYGGVEAVVAAVLAVEAALDGGRQSGLELDAESIRRAPK